MTIALYHYYTGRDGHIESGCKYVIENSLSICFGQWEGSENEGQKKEKRNK